MSPNNSYLSVFCRNYCAISINTRTSRVTVAAANMPRLFTAIDDQLLKERVKKMAAKRKLTEFLLIYAVGGREISFEYVSLPSVATVEIEPHGKSVRCLPDYIRPYLQRTVMD